MMMTITSICTVERFLHAASDDNDGASSHSYMRCWKGHPYSVHYQLFVDTMTIGGHVVIVDLGSSKE